MYFFTKAKFYLKAILLGFTLVAFMQMSYADEFKLGYVDVGKIFTTAKPAIAIQSNLKIKFTVGQQELQKLNAVLINEQTQMQAIMKKAPSMDKLSTTDQAALKKLSGQYQKDQIAFQEKYAPFQQQLQKAQDIASALLLGRVNAILEQISKKGGYDLVLTSNQLVYARPKYDLTDQIIQQLNNVNLPELLKQLDNAQNKPATPNNMQMLEHSSQEHIPLIH